MNVLLMSIKRFVKDEEGVTAIEYGLIAALIAVVIAGTVATVGSDLKTTFTTIATCLSTPASC